RCEYHTITIRWHIRFASTRPEDEIARVNAHACQHANGRSACDAFAPYPISVVTGLWIAPADTERLRRKLLDNGNVSRGWFGGERLKCPGCHATALAEFRLADVCVPSGI